MGCDPAALRADPFAFLASALDDPACVWSFGPFGAVGRFPARDPARAQVWRDADAATCITPDAALRLTRAAGLVPVAFEVLSSDPASWNHGVALCMPVAPGPAVPCASGRDTSALRASGRGRPLHDLGLASAQARLCVRGDDAARAAASALLEGRNGNGSEEGCLPPGADWVVLTAAGRLEVAGTDLLILPALLRGRRTHAATTPVPPGHVPCGYLFPLHPARTAPGHARPFDLACHARFQAMFAAFGPPAHVRLKQVVLAALAAGQGPDAVAVPADRHARACLRVTLRQQRLIAPSALLDRWIAAFDRTVPA